MRTMENENLRVQISDHGAELSSIYDKAADREAVWTGDPAFWNRHAPVLFPFVGKVNGGFYTHKGVKYPMGHHGLSRDNEFGGRGICQEPAASTAPIPAKRMGEATTIAIVATDADLTQAAAQRMATAAHDGMARAIVPSHTLLDGDLVFASASGEKPLTDPITDSFQIGHAAAICLARAIARAVFAATPLPGDLQPTWQSLYKK